MNKRFLDEQIINILREAETGGGRYTHEKIFLIGTRTAFFLNVAANHLKFY